MWYKGKVLEWGALVDPPRTIYFIVGSTWRYAYGPIMEEKTAQIIPTDATVAYREPVMVGWVLIQVVCIRKFGLNYFIIN